MNVQAGDLADPKVLALLHEHLLGMQASSPPGSVYALDAGGLQGADVAFYSVWSEDGDQLISIGALKEIDPATGEIKSMRTAQAHLRQGAAAALLDFLITAARDRGYQRLYLETGSGPVFEPALALYRRYGFENCGPFGGYGASAFNQFLLLEL